MRSLKSIKGPSWKAISIFLVSFIILIIAFIFYLVQDLAALKNLEKAKPALSTQVYSKDGTLIHQYFTHNREHVDFSQFPNSLVEALVATEDDTFWDHWGISLRGVLRAVVVDLMQMRFAEGFSTITMQLARNLYNEIGSQKSIVRKIREIITAIEIERHYSKQEIVEMKMEVENATFLLKRIMMNFSIKLKE